MSSYFKIFLIIMLFGLNSAFPEVSVKIRTSDPEKAWVGELDRRTHIIIEDIRNKFALSPDSVVIIIADSREEFHKTLDPHFPDWGQAAANYSRGTIILKHPAKSGQDMDEYYRTLAHELVHLSLLPRIRGHYFPRWMNEGLAQYYSSQMTLEQKVLLGQAAAFNGFTSLSKIDDVLKFNRRKANLAYAQSLSAFTWLYESFGDTVFQRFIGLLPEMYYDEALETVYGFDEGHLNLYWENYAVRHYRAYVFLDVYSILWGLAPLLVLAGWLRKKILSRRQYRLWEYEERIQETMKSDPPSMDKYLN